MAGPSSSLLAYPLLIERAIGLSQQRALWIAGVFVLLGLLVLAAAVQATRLAGGRDGCHCPAAMSRCAADDVQAPTRSGLRLRWIALAAIPAGLLSAVTNQVTTDLISAPLLWVIPLAVYLASFVIVFSVRGRRLLPLAIVAAPAALTLLWIPIGSAGVWPIVPLLVVEYLGLGVAAVALHGRLAESRPPDRYLTEFYLLLSTGGALGGLFVAIVAPLAFDGVWELPILIVAALAALALTAPPLPRMRPSRRMLHGAVPAAGPVPRGRHPAAAARRPGRRHGVHGRVALGARGRARAAVRRRRQVPHPHDGRGADPRDVRPGAARRVPRPQLLRGHGGAAHGDRDDPDARDDRAWPAGAQSGRSGRSWLVLRRSPARSATSSGSGTRSPRAGSSSRAWAPEHSRVYARPEDDLAFYEIDPLVARVAEDPSLFTYLSDREPPAEVDLGDGRLLVGASPRPAASGS